ncbi:MULTISPECIES: hypothetical protein [unclassified Pseudomonas]|uniref:hypothetical protein n=1 Tax=unclassified Pseudomonas TaxID=196821 RepID=UPI0021153E98|nr:MULTISPECIES: hypothetical protein [unclassified Pseudomonas]
MANLVPLTTSPSKTPVLLIDTCASYMDLQECAEQRLGVAKGLLSSLATITISTAHAEEISKFADAAYLLLEDASDLFKAAHRAAKREGAGHGI